MTDRKLRVFLCHASQDKPILRELYKRLLAEGWIDPWLNEEKLLPGQDWGMEIEKAVEAADAVVVCLSNNSVTKEGYVQKEVRFVLEISYEKPEETIFVFPLRLDDCIVPRRLRIWQYVDFFPEPRKDWVYQKLFESLQTRFEQVVYRDIYEVDNQNPENLIIEEETITELTDRLARLISEAGLSEAQVKMLELDRQGYSNEVIAKMLKTDVSTIYSRRSDALRKLYRHAKQLGNQ